MHGERTADTRRDAGFVGARELTARSRAGGFATGTEKSNQMSSSSAPQSSLGLMACTGIVVGNMVGPHDTHQSACTCG